MKTESKMWLLLISIPASLGILFIIFYSTREVPVARPPLGEVPVDWPPPGQGAYERMIPSFVLWFSLVLAVLVIVPTSYYLVSKRLDEKLERNMKLILRLLDKDNSISKTQPGGLGESIILKFLNGNQKRVLEKLIEKKGAALQSEISRMEGMTTLKTHRAIKDLEKKGIIKTEGHGKTNRVILVEDIKDILLK